LTPGGAIHFSRGAAAGGVRRPGPRAIPAPGRSSDLWIQWDRSVRTVETRIPIIELKRILADEALKHRVVAPRTVAVRAGSN